MDIAVRQAGRIVDVIVEVEAEGSQTESNLQIIKITPCLFY